MVVTQIIIAELKQASTAEELSKNEDFQTYLKRALGHDDGKGIVWGIVDGQPTRLIIAADWADKLPDKVKEVVEQFLSSITTSIKSHVQVRFEKSPVQLVDTSSKPVLELVQVILKEDVSVSEYKEIVDTVFEGCAHSVGPALEENSSKYFTTVAAWPTIDDAKQAKFTGKAVQARSRMPPMCAGFVGHFQIIAQVVSR